MSTLWKTSSVFLASSLVAFDMYGSIGKSIKTKQPTNGLYHSPLPLSLFLCLLYRDLKDLPDQVGERQENVYNLETAITKVILASYKHNKKEHPDGGDAQQQQNMENGTGESTGYIIPKKLRPTHRVKPSFLPFGLPLVGRKVDSIDYYNTEIARQNEEIQAKQRDVKNLPQLNSAFIEFHFQSAAQMAAQTLIHHTELQMAPRYVQIAPSDIIWDNMNIKSFERLIRRMVSISVTTAIIIFWAIPGMYHKNYNARTLY
jgi:hypothetical protein